MWGCADNNDTKQGKVNRERWNIMVKSKVIKKRPIIPQTPKG